jgi:hypothetical protein
MISGATTTVEQMLADPDVSPYLGGMLTPNTSNSVERVCGWNLPWCADAGCFPVEAFSASRYMATVVRVAEALVRPVFVVVPDVVNMTPEGPVGNHEATLRQFQVWQPRLGPFRLPLAFVTQDGMGLDELEDEVPWDDIAAVFIGGSDEFKDEMTGAVADACKARGKWVHLGRVNGRRRLKLAVLADVDSVDGSSLSKFPRVWLRKFATDIKEIQQEVCWLDRLNQQLQADIANWDALLAAHDPTICRHGLIRSQASVSHRELKRDRAPARRCAPGRRAPD